MIRGTLLAATLLALAPAIPASAFEPRNPECIAPAAPGGGFDLTCRITSQQLNQLGICLLYTSDAADE